MLTVENLSFYYGKRRILSGISFEIQAGTMTALLGPNGSGKTTLMRCINSLLKPESGSISINGTLVSRLPTSEKAGLAAYMTQRCGLSGLTVFDSVLLGRKPYFSPHASSADLQIVENMLKQLSLHHLALHRLDQLSGGELQKVSLARTLVQNTPILLLDEPASFLDLKNKMEILSLLKEFVQQRHLIVLMSIHDLNDALRFCGRLLFLKDGVLLFDNTCETLTEDVIERVYGLPVELHRTEKTNFIIPA